MIFSIITITIGLMMSVGSMIYWQGLDVNVIKSIDSYEIICFTGIIYLIGLFLIHSGFKSMIGGSVS